MPLSQREQTVQMLAQLRLLDPSASAEVGTPERAIIDTVAAAIADNQIDLTVLQGQLDFESKFGENLDRFLTLFGFNRQSSTFAEGYVEIGRLVPATTDIRVPAGTQVLAPAQTTVDEGAGEPVAATSSVVFTTLFDGFIRAGETTIIVPIRATTPGTVGNVADGRITTFTGTPPVGVTEVTNTQPTRGGLDAESDEEYKVRFKNTVFRNLAGTQDQYIALALALALSTKANVVGPVSRYREYIQVPQVADNASYTIGAVNYGAGNGIAGEYSTALSTNPYAKYIWSDTPFFISNGDLGVDAVFYRPETDFRMNTGGQQKYVGDAFRFFVNVIPALDADPRAIEQTARPNITFTNVYTGTNDEVVAIRPSDVVLLEFSYMSNVSRNSYDMRILNCVDVFVDGVNDTAADTIIPRPTSANLIVNDSTSKYHYDNFRRAGEPRRRPLLGNALTPLFWQPVTELPDQITVVDGVNTYTLTKGVHYWLVQDVSDHYGTVRARNGIEWSVGVGAQASGDPANGPFTGLYVTELAAATAIEVTGYSYDRNIVDLQISLDTNKQITTDALGHKARPRYFKLDVSVMYTQGASIPATNLAMRDALVAFLNDQYFGSIIQLSDLLQVLHNVSGVDNVRWSSDVPNQPATTRVYDTDRFGQPLLNVLVGRRQQASVSRGVSEIQQIVLHGSPTGGTYKLKYGSNTSATINHNANAATIKTRVDAITSLTTTVTGSGTAADPFIVTFPSTATRSLLEVVELALTGGDTLHATDFILRDDELPALPEEAQPGDNVPGLIIRPRAQHTWVKL